MQKLAFMAISVLLLFTPLTASAQDATVSTSSTAALGTFLTTTGGMTLYISKNDSPGVSTVTGQLAVVWPPLTASAPLTLPSGVGGSLSFITRPDGSQQVAYNGMPLYTFQGDSAGTVNGQNGGPNGQFVVASVTAAAVTSPTAAPAATSVASPTAAPAATSVASPTAAPAATSVASPTAAPAATSVASPTAAAVVASPTAVASATKVASATATASPTALPRAGEPSAPAGMAALLGLAVLAVGAYLRRRLQHSEN